MKPKECSYCGEITQDYDTHKVVIGPIKTVVYVCKTCTPYFIKSMDASLKARGKCPKHS